METGGLACISSTRVFVSSYYSVYHNDSYMCETLSKISFSKRYLQSSLFIANGSPLKEIFNSR